MVQSATNCYLDLSRRELLGALCANTEGDAMKPIALWPTALETLLALGEHYSPVMILP